MHYLCNMLNMEQIKDGLFYSIQKTRTNEEDGTLLQRNREQIKLRFLHTQNAEIAFSKQLDNKHEIILVFTQAYLNSYASADALFPMNEFATLQQQDNCCTTQLILHEMIQDIQEGIAKKMFIESKALSLLLCYKKSQVSTNLNCATCKFLLQPVEKEKIVSAKEILLNSLNNPPTISALSLQIGINQCYLKKGFKELFGTTVYDFIQEQRMLKAKLLLSSSDLTIKQIAHEIGFANAGNFSAAFKKFTGVFPSEFSTN
jgi:AraC-like DNA-binding protein